jgi:hypothetical protein
LRVSDSAFDAVALRDAGKSVPEIAEIQGCSESQVYRRLKSAEDGPGPTERAARALVAGWGEIDAARRLTAETLIGLAVIGDVGRSRQANGVDRSAGVAAFKELKLMQADMGESSGAEALIAALRAR